MEADDRLETSKFVIHFHLEVSPGTSASVVNIWFLSFYQAFIASKKRTKWTTNRLLTNRHAIPRLFWRMLLESRLESDVAVWKVIP